MKKVFTILGFLMAMGVSAGELTWETDLDLAKDRAKKEHKTILMNFTGSDWCGWCKRLDKEVFSQDAFQEFANANLILVKVDFPKFTKLPKELEEKNWKLAEKYGVGGFPAILLVDDAGQEKLRTGYIGGGPETYVNRLKQGM